MGVIKGVPKDLSPEEILNALTIPSGFGEVIKIRRFNRKCTLDDGSLSREPTETILLTFEGQKLPPRVYLLYTSLIVDPYKYPVTQCFNCCRYGHIKNQCRSIARCFKCAQPHSGETCNIDSKNVSCLFCSGSHTAIDKMCPEKSRQQAIKITMTEECISFQEASRKHPSVRRMFSEVTKSSFSQEQAVAHNLNTPSIPKPSASSSYKKTMFLQPRPKPILVPGYDKQAHDNIIKEWAIPSSQNGCALPSSNSSYT